MIKVFVIDDSATVRTAISDLVNQASDMCCVGSAIDPIFGWNKMQKNWPDVLVLDLEMPRKDGITFLKELMVNRPLPVLICSSNAKEGSFKAIEALSHGAIDVFNKTEFDIKNFLDDNAHSLLDAIRNCASTNKYFLQSEAVETTSIAEQKNDGVKLKLAKKILSGASAICIGASTGGTQALEKILAKLPINLPPILVVQHMTAGFTLAFSKRLNELCALTVIEAENGMPVQNGNVYIAEGDQHMQIRMEKNQLFLVVKKGPKVSRHRPSVNVLFQSAAHVLQQNAMGIILTGMGDDGALHLKTMHDRGSFTIGQDMQTSAVYGMPKVALEMGGVDVSLPLDEIYKYIIAWAKNIES